MRNQAFAASTFSAASAKKGVASALGMNAVGVERFPGCLFAIQQSLIKVDDRTVHVRTIVQEPLAIAAEDLIMTMYGTGFLPAIVGAFRFGQWWNADITGSSWDFNSETRLSIFRQTAEKSLSRRISLEPPMTKKAS